jgi:hypothetical protein
MAFNRSAIESHGSGAATRTLALTGEQGRNCERHDALGGRADGWHSGAPVPQPRLVLRSTHAWIASAAFTLTAALTLPGTAQAQQPRQGSQQPVKDEQLTRMIQVSAVTVCNLSKAKISFETAIGASSSAVSAYVVQVHGGKFEGVAEALPPEQIFQAITTNIAVQSYRICKEVIPAESTKKIEDIIKNSQAATKK